jgi:hypothetical protein
MEIHMSRWEKFSAKLSTNASDPNCPGVYVFSFAERVVYVGMSGNIRNRMRGHKIANVCGPNLHDGYVRTPWGNLPWADGKFSAKYKATGSCADALALEGKLIRKIRPEFNIRGVPNA